MPPTNYRLDAQGELAVWAASTAAVNAVAISVQQAFYTSKDGTRAPIFILHAKENVPDGARPTVLTGYGGFNISRRPTYQPAIYPWLEQGGGYALAVLRGGGEYGEEWHAVGMLGQKQNVFDDFIAAAEYLIDAGYTRPERLGILGRSNGGLLVGAAMTQRPELFGAVVCGVPLLDMVRYHKFLIGALWISEYGSADDPEQFPWLHGYSPYHRVAEGTPYPATFLFAAESDTRVDPLHVRKMAALLQHTSPETPVLLRVAPEAGHGDGAAKAYQRLPAFTTIIYRIHPQCSIIDCEMMPVEVRAMESRTMPPWLRWGSNIALVACVLMIVLSLAARHWETAAELICFTGFWVWGMVHFRPR